MNKSEIKNPNVKLTLGMIVGSFLSFSGVISPWGRTEVGFSLLGYVCILGANICFWGLVYRISKHLEYYLQGRAFGGLIRILLLAFFVVSFIFLMSILISKISSV